MSDDSPCEHGNIPKDCYICKIMIEEYYTTKENIEDWERQLYDWVRRCEEL